jgi:hypothetical protein
MKRPDFLFVPMEYSPKYGEPNEEDIEAMSERVRLLGARAFIVNSFPPGGAWVFEQDGTLLVSTRGEETLLWGGGNPKILPSSIISGGVPWSSTMLMSSGSSISASAW